MKRVTLIETYLNENLYSSPDRPAFPIQKGLKQQDARRHFFSNFF